MDKLENVIKKIKKEYNTIKKKKMNYVKTFELVIKQAPKPKVITQTTSVGIVSVEHGKFTIYI